MLRALADRGLLSSRSAIAVACLLTAGYLWSEGRDAQRVEKANELALSGDYAAALREAGEVEGPPAEVRALLLTANAHFAAGRYGAAARAFADLARRDPENWIVHSEWARVLLADGNRKAARGRYARARQLNPELPPLIPEPGG